LLAKTNASDISSAALYYFDAVEGTDNQFYVYTVDENGTKTELKKYEVTPAVVTVNVSKLIEFNVDVVTVGHEDYNYVIDPTNLVGTFAVIGTVHDIESIHSAKVVLDYQSVQESIGNHKIPVSTVTFYDVDGNFIFDETNKSETLKYDISGIQIPVLVESKNPGTETESQTEDK
jgi:hypothetical protein